MRDYKFGIDEAGRGPLAGPVSVCVFGVSKGVFDTSGFPKSRDSKKMNEREREKWMKVFDEEKQKGNLVFEQVFGTNKMIDSMGIVYAIKHAMKRCLDKLSVNGHLCQESIILLDGALKAPNEFKKQQTIIKGDEKEQVIAAASIVAKVKRDEFMKELCTKHPEYGFEIHKGYGTKMHRENIKKHGVSEAHRITYCKIK